MPPSPRFTIDNFALSVQRAHHAAVTRKSQIGFDPYRGFAQYEVVPGDTFSSIAQHWYGNGALFPRIFEANRDQTTNPNLIFPGQVLRIPQ